MDKKKTRIDSQEVWDSIQVGDSVEIYRQAFYNEKEYLMKLGTFGVYKRETYGRGPGLPREVFELTNEVGETLRRSDYPVMYLIKGDSK